MFSTVSLRRGLTGLVPLVVVLACVASVRTVAAAEPAGLKFSKRCLMISPNEGCAIADANRDGKPDVIAGSHWFAGPDFIPHPLRDIPQVSLGFGAAEFYASNGDHPCDVNGDGREDILCAVGWYENPGGDVFAKPWTLHPETKLSGAASPFLVVDVNGDGRNDIVWGKGHDYGVYWRQQGPPKPDGTTTWTEHLIDKSWSQAHTLTWADLDGDGQGELITGKRVRGHGDMDPGAAEPECLYYYKWDKAAARFVRYTISPPGGGVGTGMQICVADLNGDGRPDIAVSGKTGTWVLLNEGK